MKNMKKTKVLQVHGGSMMRGGTEAFIMNLLNHIDYDKFEVDVVVHGDKPGIYDQEIKDLGCKLFSVPIKSKNPIKNQQALEKIMREGQYDVVHSHLNAMNGPLLEIAKKFDVQHRISHSHASEHYTNSKLKIMMGERAKKKIPLYATELFSCSQLAGEFLYGELPFVIIKNAIDTNKYLYNEKVRISLKKDLGLKDELVFGHVGRFVYQKNHLELIEIFNQIQKDTPNSVLLLVGDGELLEETKEQVIKLGLKEKVKFLGVLDNIPSLLSVFDHFLLPSNFEGLPFVLVEAQCNGINILCADTVDKNVKITDLVHILPLGNNALWVKKFKDTQNYKRFSRNQELADAGYAIESQVKFICDLYENKGD